MKKPNILFIFSDQHRSCDLNCYGNKDIISPHFDSLAASGLRLTNCVANSPVCVPMRGTLLTGYYSSKHRALTNDIKIDTQIKGVGDVLEDAGYHTGYIGKWHLGGVPRNRYIQKHERLGFKEWKVANCTHDYNDSYFYDEKDHYHPIEGYEPFVQTDMAMDFIKKNSGKEKEPWALYLSWGPPHAPYETAPEKYRNLYQDKEINLRENVTSPAMMNGRLNQYRNREEITRDLKGYYAHITALDHALGRLMDTLKETGNAENTLVVYTSDHGDMLGSHGIYKKQSPYAESLLVPCLLSWPGKIEPGVSNGIMSLADLPVTLLKACGMDFPEKRDGQDLTEFLLGRQREGAESAYIYNQVPCHQAMDRGDSEWYGVKTSSLTYAVNFDGSYEALYDDEKDPYQKINCAADSTYTSQLKEMKRMLTDHMKKAGEELLPWREYITRYGYKEEWNSSQQQQNRPPEELI
jgi:arylsulfatase A-like enzyme